MTDEEKGLETSIDVLIISSDDSIVETEEAESPQDENFRCSDHAERSLQRMENCLQNQQLTDVVLCVGERRISAHRLVLSACSEYFAAMFSSGLRESFQTEIELQDIDPDCLQELVHYCYTGCLDLKEETVELMLATSSLLQIPQVTDACSKFLEKRLHPSNCIGIALFADTQNCPCLLEKAHNFTTEHFMEVIGNQEFLQLDANSFAKLLASYELNVPNEEDVVNALITWAKFAPETRQENISKLLENVKLSLLSPSFIVDHIESEPLFSHDPKCNELIMEAMKYHLLPERRSISSARSRPRKSTVGKLCAVGGIDASKGANSIELYDLRANKWSPFANMSGQRLQFGVAQLGDKILVVGGRDGLKTMSIVESFDFVTKTWSSLPNMATPRHGLGVGVLGGPLYAVGGHDGWSYLNSVERWDPQTKDWNYVAPMTSQRSTVGVAVLGDRLYAVGGRDGSVCLQSVECYDPYTNKWIPCAPMAKQRGGAGVVAMNGCLYVCGGHAAPASYPSVARLECCERYDPKTDSWSPVAPMSVGRDGVGVCVLGDKLMAVGGYDGTQYLDLVEAYDPLANTWSLMAPMNMKRASTCTIVI
ncbi:kelch-like protein 5 [Neocloeon triangulifer]|uniref:kelch-like protein 5 n=1 Tax=Neocloeon triangulifer TaxID=2078957 RepID=UPI00286F6A8E|nr:kelch-like protein 5 [Neocloeon triangulifer]